MKNGKNRTKATIFNTVLKVSCFSIAIDLSPRLEISETRTILTAWRFPPTFQISSEQRPREETFLSKQIRYVK